MTVPADRCPTCGVDLAEPVQTDNCPSPEDHAPVSPLHPTIRLLADVAGAGEYIRNRFHGIDIPTTAASSSMVGWVRLAAEEADEGSIDLYRLSANGTCYWSATFSSSAPVAVLCAAIAEALAS